MKQYLILMAMATAAILNGCDSDTLNEELPEEATEEVVNPNGETSYSFLIDEEGAASNLYKPMSGYYDEATGECKLLAEHEEFVDFVETEEVIMPEFHEDIILFYYLGSFRTRLNAVFRPKKGAKSKFIISVAALGEDGVKGIEIGEETIYNWPH